MYLIKAKNITATKKELKQSAKDIGDYYSVDRFYTLLNNYIDVNLTYKSKTLAFIIKYLFKSGSYKHDTSIANGKSIGVILLDIFCVLCIIGFFAMVIAVLGRSFTVPNGVGGFVNFAEGFVQSLGGNITMLIFAIIFGVISILYIVMYFKIRKKNKKLSLKDYVTKKVDFILMLSWLIKLSAKIKKTVFKEAKVEVHYIKKFEQQGGAGDRWLNLQLINLLCSIFGNFSLVFIFDTLTDDEYKEIDEIIKVDFKRIEIVEYNN